VARTHRAAGREADARPARDGASGPAAEPVSITGAAEGPDRDRSAIAARLEEIADPLRAPVRTVNGWWQWVKTLKPYRVWIQFSYNDGNQRTAGMSYSSLFAIFAALWVGFSIAGVWLVNSPNLMDSLVAMINDAAPGLIATSTHSGVISTDTLTSLSSTFGWTSAIALVGLLWTAIAWLYYTRQAVRAMFGLGRDERNYWVQKVTDLGLAIVFGVLLVVSAAVSVLTIEAVTALLHLVGIDGHSFWTYLLARVIGFALSIALNFVVLAAMFRVLSRVAIPWPSLVTGSLLGAIALSALSALSGLVFGGTSSNPLLATFTVFVGLLLWFNLICRIILLAAAWIAVGMSDRGLDPQRRTPEQIAYDDALAAHSERLLLARAAVQAAEEEAAAAGWPGVWFAGRRLRAARLRRDEVEAEPVPQPPQKRNWWLEENVRGSQDSGSQDRGSQDKTTSAAKTDATTTAPEQRTSTD
jgi:membrane protein